MDESIAKLQHRDIHERHFLKMKVKPITPSWLGNKVKKRIRIQNERESISSQRQDFSQSLSDGIAHVKAAPKCDKTHAHCEVPNHHRPSYQTSGRVPSRLVTSIWGKLWCNKTLVAQVDPHECMRLTTDKRQ